MVPSTLAGRVAVLLLLSICAYLPALRLPFIADDYGQISLARDYTASGWEPLLHKPTLRTRATYMLLSAGLDRVFGFKPMPFYAASILLHALCVLLLYALSIWRPIGRSAAFLAACFFAVHEGHQEAVLWLAAAHNLIVFVFGMAALVSWVKWLESRRRLWYAVALASILIAAASQEMFWVFVFLMLVVTIHARRKRDMIPALVGFSPFLGLSFVYLVSMWMTYVGPGARMDGRFVISGAAWLAVAANSVWRLLLPQGFMALALLLWLHRRGDWYPIAFACPWIVLGIAPHSFITYMSSIASRDTYLASTGLALLIGAALSRLSKKIPRTAFAAICAVILLANVEILWVKKMSQFRERAEPTELLKTAARNAVGPITVECTPVADIVVEYALASVGSKAVFPKPENHTERCFAIEYTDRGGSPVRVDRQIGTKHGAFY